MSEVLSPPARLSKSAVDLLFREARSHKAWLPRFAFDEVSAWA